METRAIALRAAVVAVILIAVALVGGPGVLLWVALGFAAGLWW